MKKVNFFFLILALCFTNTLSLMTLKKLEIENIKIYGSELFSKEDIVENSSLDLSTRLIFVKTKLIEKELKQNLTLEKISVSRQILPFGLRVLIKTRTPVAYGERILKGKKLAGYVDQYGYFIDQKNTEKVNLNKFKLRVFGWKDDFKKTLSIIIASQMKNEVDLIKISFSENGFLTLEEQDLKTIYLGFDPKLISSQIQIISNLKNQLIKNNLSRGFDKIDLTDPKNPIIKVFKP